jgi:hypothetical protein
MPSNAPDKERSKDRFIIYNFKGCKYTKNDSYFRFLNTTLSARRKFITPDTHIAERLQMRTSHPVNLSIRRRAQKRNIKTPEQEILYAAYLRKKNPGLLLGATLSFQT